MVDNNYTKEALRYKIDQILSEISTEK
jgi:hypothetical protein